MVLVQRLGPLLDESAESLAGLGALVLAANASRPLWRLDIAAYITVVGRLVFAYAYRSCPMHPRARGYARGRQCYFIVLAPRCNHVPLAHAPAGRAGMHRRLVPRRSRAGRGLGSSRAT